MSRGVQFGFRQHGAFPVCVEFPVHHVEAALAEFEEAACRPEQSFPDLSIVLESCKHCDCRRSQD
jgi:hypothetical protein